MRNLLIIFLILLISGVKAFPDDKADIPAWPREINTDKGTIVIYQPQLESFTGDDLEGRSAISIKLKDSDNLIFGAVWYTCRVATDLKNRIVYLENLKVTNIKLADFNDKQLDIVKNILETEIPKWDYPISLDQMLASLENIEQVKALSDNLDNTPPEIIFLGYPAILILIDGEPQLRNVEDSDLMYVINTPFFIVQEPKTQKYYLKGGTHWYASDKATGEYEEINKPPKSVRKLAEKGEDEELKEDKKSEEVSIVPKIIIRTKPAELISSDGDPAYKAIPGTNLLFLDNTDSYLFIDIPTQQYYTLLSGRWYITSDLTKGPWTFLNPDDLPDDFRNIPEESEIGFVLASVPGTQQAKEALMENQIPQTAIVNRKEATLEVLYEGDPKFEKIEGTDMLYAINTDKSVLKIDERYYCCDQAIWFESDDPKGPWSVSTAVPDDVQNIPPESPVYNTKYVYIYDYTPTVVYVGYTPGYYGSYVYGGVVVYGTGYYYYPWYGAYYYPRPATYGFGVHYNPYSGWSFSVGVRFGGSAGWVSIGYHSPMHYHAGWWGPAGYRHGYYHGYNRGYYHGARAGYAAGRYDSRNIYSTRERGVRTTDRPNRNVAPADRSARTGEGRQTGQPATRDRNVLTDRSGNVYKKDGDSWKQRDNGQWRNAAQQKDRSAAQRNIQDRQGQLNRDLNSQNRGQQRSQNYNRANQNIQRSRPSTGAGRMGGRRR